MEDEQKFKKRRITVLIIVIILAILSVTAVLFWNRGSEVYNPNENTLLDHEDGTIFYQAEELYTAIDQNDTVLRAIESDVLLFAHSTRPEFKDPDVLVGFTFDKKSKKEDNTTTFTGHFYGVEDKIQIRLTAHGRGVYTLSITNLEDGTNIDDSLGMNGKRNAFIQTLPIQKAHYSIRYQLPNDRVVVSFYDGYSAIDVDEAAELIRKGMGSAENEDVIYSLNRIGIVSLEQVRQNLVTPLPQP